MITLSFLEKEKFDTVSGALFEILANNMDEIQIAPTYHGNGLFRKIYRFVFDNFTTDCNYVEAAANKLNKNSIGVLQTLGLKIVGELHGGGCALLRGSFDDLMAWYRRK